MLIIDIVLFAIWLSSSILTGVVASQKGRSPFIWVVLNILFTPIIALLALVALGDSDKKREHKRLKEEFTLNAFLSLDREMQERFVYPREWDDKGNFDHFLTQIDKYKKR